MEDIESVKAQVLREEFTFASSDAETQIHAVAWLPPSGTPTPRAVVQLAHGMVEHILRYDDFARMLAASGYAVFGHDHLGHGASVIPGCDLGQLPVGANDLLIADFHELRNIAQQRFGGVPHIVFGHSMGSFIVRCYIARHGVGLAGAIVCGTGQQPLAVSRAGGFLARSIARARGWQYRSEFVNNLGVGGYGKQIPGAKTPLDWLNTSEAAVQAYIDDPMCGQTFSVGGYASLLELTAECALPECARATPDGLPVLFIAGEGDPVGEMGKGVCRAAEALAAGGCADVNFILYPDMRHEILNEPAHELVYADVLEWLGKVAEKTADEAAEKVAG